MRAVLMSQARRCLECRAHPRFSCPVGRHWRFPTRRQVVSPGTISTGRITVVSLLWNRREARLRAGWRVALFLLATGVLSTGLSGPGRRLLGGLLPVVYANV